MSIKSNKLHSTANASGYLLSFVWKRGKRYIIWKIIKDFFNSIWLLPTLLLPGFLINELQDGNNYKIIAVYVTLIILLPFLQNVLNSLSSLYINKLRRNLDYRLKCYYYDILVGMDYEFWEIPDIQDLRGQAEEVIYSSVNIIDMISGLLSSIFGIVLISSIISSLNPVIIILIAVIVFLNSLIARKTDANNYQIDKEIRKNMREHQGIESVFETQFYAKEIRIFDLKSYFIEKYSKAVARINVFHKKKDILSIKSTMLSNVVIIFEQCCLYTYLLNEVIKNKMPVGNFTIYLTSVASFSNALSAVANAYNALAEYSLKIYDMKSFVDLFQERHQGHITPVIGSSSTITFKNIYFKYPGSDTYALKNFNLTVRADENLCVVGLNGAGKTTFIKLLLRLYSPESGEILLDGQNINEFDIHAYYKLFSPVFQDCALYHLTLKENIILSENFEFQKFKNAVEESNLSPLVRKLTKGEDTPVFKWEAEDGFDPSGGEEQRIAIARSLYRGGDIFILDEPTASLDPIAEYEIYTQFKRMIQDKCAILITHRLSAVKLADKIAVFDDGQVVEYGTHQELYDKGGIYREMFDKQAQFYRDESRGGEANA